MLLVFEEVVLVELLEVVDLVLDLVEEGAVLEDEPPLHVPPTGLHPAPQ